MFKSNIDYDEFTENLEEDEERFINIGKINSKFYTVVSTIREDKIRIISARRARKKEIEIYES